MERNQSLVPFLSLCLKPSILQASDKRMFHLKHSLSQEPYGGASWELVARMNCSW